MVLVCRDHAQYKTSHKKQCRPRQGSGDTPGSIFADASQSVDILEANVCTYKDWKVWTAIVAAKKTQKAIAAPLLGTYAYTEYDQSLKGPTTMSLRTREVRRPCHIGDPVIEQSTKMSLNQSKNMNGLINNQSIQYMSAQKLLPPFSSRILGTNLYTPFITSLG